MNSILQRIQERRSIRNFESKELSQEQLEDLRLAALASPTARDSQQMKFSFILDHNVIEEINQEAQRQLKQANDIETLERIKSRHKSIFFGAPLLIVISGPEADSYSPINAGIAVQTLALAAQGMGLGSCIIGMAHRAFSGDRAAKFKEMAGIQADNKFFIAISIGYPAMTKDAHQFKAENISFIR